MSKKPVRLNKKQPIIENNMIFGIPISFIIFAILAISFIIFVLFFMGSCTESGMLYNKLHT